MAPKKPFPLERITALVSTFIIDEFTVKLPSRAALVRTLNVPVTLMVAASPVFVETTVANAPSPMVKLPRIVRVNPFAKIRLVVIIHVE